MLGQREHATRTLDGYGHLFGDEVDGVANRLDPARHADFSRTRGEAKMLKLDSRTA